MLACCVSAADGYGAAVAQYDYSSIMGMSYRFYDAERVGALPANYSIPWRGPAFLQEVGPKAQGFGNMTGGFMTGARQPHWNYDGTLAYHKVCRTRLCDWQSLMVVSHRGV